MSSVRGRRVRFGRGVTTVAVLVAGLVAAPVGVASAAPVDVRSTTARVDDEETDRSGRAHARVRPGARAVDLGVPGEQSRATHVSRSGTYVTGLAVVDGVDRVFRWHAGQVEVYPWIDGAVPLGIIDDGRTLLSGYDGPDPLPHLYVWGTDGSLTEVVSTDTSSTYGYLDESGYLAYTYVAKPEGTRAGLAVPDGGLPLEAVRGWENGAVDVNSRGDVVGWARESTEFAFARRDGVLAYLELPEPQSAGAVAVNERSQVLVRIRPELGAPGRLVLWQPDGRVDELDPRGLGFDGSALDDRGVVAGRVTVPREQAAVADTRRGVRVLRGYGDLPSAALQLNDAGVVVGHAVRDAADGRPHATAWVAGRPVALGERLRPGAGAESVASDVDARGRAVGYVSVAVPGQPERQRAVLWDIVPRR